MCKICKRLICPRECPSFEERERKGQRVICVLCGDLMDVGERYYRMHGFPYCEKCLLSETGASLVRICEKEKRNFFENMGFSIEIVGVEA